MKTEDTLRTAQAAARERDEITLKLRGISAVMLAQTGETWPCPGAKHTASTRAAALSSVSNRALRTAPMKPKAEAVE